MVPAKPILGNHLCGWIASGGTISEAVQVPPVCLI